MQNFSIYPISWSKAYEEQLVLRTDEGKYLHIINDKDRYLGGTITFWREDYAALADYGFQAIKN